MDKQLQREQTLLEMLYEKNEIIKQLYQKIAELEKQLKEKDEGGN
jgi:hypothetical protein